MIKLIEILNDAEKEIDNIETGKIKNIGRKGYVTKKEALAYQRGKKYVVNEIISLINDETNCVKCDRPKRKKTFLNKDGEVCVSWICDYCNKKIK